MPTPDNSAINWIDLGLRFQKNLASNHETLLDPEIQEQLKDKSPLEQAAYCYCKAIQQNNASGWVQLGLLIECNKLYINKISFTSDTSDIWQQLRRYGDYVWQAAYCYGKAVQQNDAYGWYNLGVVLAKHYSRPYLSGLCKTILDREISLQFEHRSPLEQAALCFGKAIKIDNQLAVAWLCIGIGMSRSRILGMNFSAKAVCFPDTVWQVLKNKDSQWVVQYCAWQYTLISGKIAPDKYKDFYGTEFLSDYALALFGSSTPNLEESIREILTTRIRLTSDVAVLTWLDQWINQSENRDQLQKKLASMLRNKLTMTMVNLLEIALSSQETNEQQIQETIDKAAPQARKFLDIIKKIVSFIPEEAKSSILNAISHVKQQLQQQKQEQQQNSWGHKLSTSFAGVWGKPHTRVEPLATEIELHDMHRKTS